MPGHHSQCVCMVLPRAAVRTQMPGCHSLSALSAANIQKKSVTSNRSNGLFSFFIDFLIYHCIFNVNMQFMNATEIIYLIKKRDSNT